jgi:hypothetical protein
MRIGVALALAFILLTTAEGVTVAQTSSSACQSPQQPKRVAELLFGRNIGGKPGVSDADWARFVARELTLRFPDGLTIADASGQSRNPADGTIVREAAKRVEIVLPGNDDDQARLDAVVTAYKREFKQHSVAVIVQSACVSF